MMWSARCSAAGRRSPMVMMTARSSQRSRMSQAWSGGRQRGAGGAVVDLDDHGSGRVGLVGQWGGSFQDRRRRPGSGQDRDEPLSGEGKLLPGQRPWSSRRKGWGSRRQAGRSLAGQPVTVSAG